MRRSKAIGFGLMALAILSVVGAAVLPVSPVTEGVGPFRIDMTGNNCGPAGYVLYDEGNSLCKQAAQKRILTASGLGVLVLACGMALYAGGDAPRGSRIRMGPPRVSRREARRNRGSRRYMPG